MSKNQKKKKIKLVHESMNHQSASAFQLIIKLSYHLPQKNQPQLEVFPDNQYTRSNEWSVYGAQENSNEPVAVVTFTEPNQVKSFKILEQEFQIQWTHMDEVEVNYPRGGLQLEPQYHFEIEPR